KRLLVPVRQAAVLKYRGLPVLDLHFPRRVISERITGDERRGAAITPVEAGIAAEPGAPLTEAGARHIPRQRKNYLPRLTRRHADRRAHRRADRLAGDAGAHVNTVAEATVGSEVRPQRRAIAIRRKA